jgi:hypothetical protein
MSNSSGNDKSSSSMLQRIQELRVADHELHTIGTGTHGAVFVRVSPGAVAILTDRPVAQARVSRLLRQAVEEQETTYEASITKTKTTTSSK